MGWALGVVDILIEIKEYVWNVEQLQGELGGGLNLDCKKKRINKIFKKVNQGGGVVQKYSQTMQASIN